MSRSGSDERKADAVTRLRSEDLKRLNDYAQKKGIKAYMILGNFIVQGVEHNIYDEDWAKKAKAISTEYVAETDCPALCKIDGNYFCLWAREGKTPDKKKLAEERISALNACEACDKTALILKHNEELRVKVGELEEKLEEKARVTFKAPLCNYGANLGRDGETFSGCRRKPREKVSVKEFCKKYANGLPCSMYAEAIIGVGEKT